MKSLSIILAFALFTYVGMAQEHKNETILKVAEVAPTDVEVQDDGEYLNGMVPVASFKADLPCATVDSLHLPEINYRGSVRHMGYWPSFYDGYCGWDLHEGLNMMLGASVSVGFGKYAPKGAGFSERLSMVYAKPINDHLSFAVGGYFENMNWGRFNYRSGGISGVLSYRFNDHWDAFVYGQKSIVNNGMMLPYPYYNMFELGDRIGAGIGYNFNERLRIQMSVDYGTMPRNFHKRLEDNWQMPQSRQ